MYLPERFNETDKDKIYKLICENAFATVITVQEGLPTASHLPLLVEMNDGRYRLLGHLAKGNKQWMQFDSDQEILIIFQGPHGYISPSNYEVPLVPTWNYAAVHMYGKARVVKAENEARRIVESLSNKYEQTRAKPWIPQYSDQALERVVCFEIPVDRLETKFKLSQDRSESDRKSVITDLAASDKGSDRALAELMSEYEV